MTTKKRQKLIEEAKAMGVSEVTIDGVVYKFQQASTTSPAMTDNQVAEAFKPKSVFDDYSEDELLYWSAPFYDELQDIKKTREQQLKDGTENV